MLIIVFNIKPKKIWSIKINVRIFKIEFKYYNLLWQVIILNILLIMVIQK